MKLGMIIVLYMRNILVTFFSSFSVFLLSSFLLNFSHISRKYTVIFNINPREFYKSFFSFVVVFWQLKTMLFNIFRFFEKYEKRPPILPPNPRFFRRIKSNVTWRQLSKNCPNVWKFFTTLVLLLGANTNLLALI